MSRQVLRSGDMIALLGLDKSARNPAAALARLRSDYKLPHVRVHSRLILYFSDQVEKWLESRRFMVIHCSVFRNAEMENILNAQAV